MLDSAGDWVNDRRESLRDTITVNEWIDDLEKWVNDTFESVFDQVDERLSWAVDTLESGLVTADPPLMAVLFGVLAVGLVLRSVGALLKPLECVVFGVLGLVTVVLSGSVLGGLLGGVVAAVLILAGLGVVTRLSDGVSLGGTALAALAAIALAWGYPGVMAGLLAALLVVLLAVGVRTRGLYSQDLTVVALGALAVAAFFMEDPIFVAVAFGAVAWRARSAAFGVVTVFGFLLIDVMRLWPSAMETLSFVLVASLLSISIGVPVGILASRRQMVSRLVKPVLDFMQTMPALVYLVAVVGFFSIGVMPGLVATIIFAMPPAVRLTELGIRQVDREVVEAGEAFGTAPSRILTRIQIPLATPTIMAGINQVIMLALSMVVLAALVGAGGLGSEVTRALAQLNTGRGVEAGLAVVILAVFLDRVTASVGERSSPERRRGQAPAPAAKKQSKQEEQEELDLATVKQSPRGVGAVGGSDQRDLDGTRRAAVELNPRAAGGAA